MVLRTAFILLFILPPTLWGQSGPRVVSVFPASHSTSAGIDAEIVVEFDGAVEPASFGVASFYVFGRWSGPARGSFTFEEDNTRVRFVSDRPFMAGEWVTVSLSRGIQGIDGEPMARGVAWNFWIATSAGAFAFPLIDVLSTRRAGEERIRSYGAYAGDFDRDGYGDLLIPNEDANDIRIFLNDGAGGYADFSTYPIPQGNIPSTNEGADFDLDGFVDVAVGNSRGSSVSVWKGDGAGGIAHLQNAPADLQVRGLCVLDADGDGYFDIVTANRLANDSAGNVSILLNDGAGWFPASMSVETGAGGETACAAADANGDGLIDLIIGAHFSNELVLMLGDGEGGFAVSDKVAAGQGVWMTAAGDVNGDGFADALSVDSNTSTVTVAFSDGNGGLREPATYRSGAFPIAIDLGDLDGDGDLDLVTSNFSSADFTVFENDGTGSFTARLSLPAETSGSCAVLHDRDNDGDLDITGIDEVEDRIFLFKNRAIASSNEVARHRSTDLVISAYPNPFYREVRISFRTEKEIFARITMYNTLGQEVRTLFESSAGPGTHTVRWDGKDSAGHDAPAGVYFYTIRTAAGSETFALMLVR